MTTVLNDYWNPPATGPVLFPFPSMAGSGDRMSTAWAVLGLTPDLSIGLDPAKPGQAPPPCQALDLDGTGDNSCAAVEHLPHLPRPNLCHAQAGAASSSRSAAAATAARRWWCAAAGAPVGGGCGLPPQKLYSAPSDNKCSGFGGCAVPISASQVFPATGQMQLYDFVQDSLARTVDVRGVRRSDGLPSAAKRCTTWPIAPTRR